MNKIIVIVLLLSAPFIGAQNKISLTEREVQNDTLIYNTSGLEVQPKFPGGIENFYAYFNSNFKATEESIKGKVTAIFIIEKDGSLSRIQVLRPLGVEIRKEIADVLKLAPKWSPGRQNEKIVRTLFSVQFPFDYSKKKEPRKK
jgi:protein TonB